MNGKVPKPNRILQKHLPLVKFEMKMSTTELRQIIGEHLSHIEDVSFLNALKTILESRVPGGEYPLTQTQKKRIQMGRTQLEKGQTISHTKLQFEIDQWLGSK